MKEEQQKAEREERDKADLIRQQKDKEDQEYRQLMERAQSSIDRQQEKQADAFTTDTVGTKIMDSLTDPLDSRAQTASKKETTDEATETQELALHQQDMQMHLNITANHSKSTVVIVPKPSVIKSKLTNATKKAAPAKLTSFQQRKAEVLDQAAVETEVDSEMQTADDFDRGQTADSADSYDHADEVGDVDNVEEQDDMVDQAALDQLKKGRKDKDNYKVLIKRLN